MLRTFANDHHDIFMALPSQIFSTEVYAFKRKIIFTPSEKQNLKRIENYFIFTSGSTDLFWKIIIRGLKVNILFEKYKRRDSV